MTIEKSYVDLSDEEKEDLLKVLSNKMMYSDDRVLDHPTALFRLLATTSGSKCLLTLIPDLQKWEEQGEKITMRRATKRLCELYGINEQINNVIKEYGM